MFTSNRTLNVIGLVWARMLMLSNLRNILLSPVVASCLRKNRLLTNMFTNGAAVPKTVEQLVGSIRVVIEHRAVGKLSPTMFSSTMAPSPFPKL